MYWAPLRFRIPTLFGVVGVVESWNPGWVVKGFGVFLYRGEIGIIGYISGLYRDNGKEHGNY